MKQYKDTVKAILKSNRINTLQGTATDGRKGIIAVELRGAWLRRHLMLSTLALTV